MSLTVPNKIPVYGYSPRPDGTFDRKLAAYITTTPEGYPLMEIKTGRTKVLVNLPVLMEQINNPPNYPN